MGRSRRIAPVVPVREVVGPVLQRKTRTKRVWVSKTTCCIPGELRPGCRVLASRTLATDHLQINALGSTRAPLTL